MLKRSLLLVVLLSLALAACGGGGGGQAAGGGASGNATNGQTLFTNGKGSAAACSGCHSLKEGEKLVGPSLAHIATDAGNIIKDPNYKGKAKDAQGYIQESIVDPNAYVVSGFPAGVMPQTYGKDLSAQDISDLVAFLMTKK